MNWLQLSDADRIAAVNVATRQLGFNTNVIEKDWWVVMALKALFGSSIKDYASFKGGTSLLHERRGNNHIQIVDGCHTANRAVPFLLNYFHFGNS